MPEFGLEFLKLPLAYTWKLSRNASTKKVNAIINFSDSKFEGRGEAAPNVRYGETPELMREQFEAWNKAANRQIFQISDVYAALKDADLCNALRFALESSMIHYLAEKERREPWQLFGLQEPKSRKTSYSLPVMELHELEGFYKSRKLDRFDILKIKTSRENAVNLVKRLYSISGKSLIVDANEAFQSAEEVMIFCEDVKAVPVEILEQPMPSGLIKEYLKLKPLCPFPLFGDESLCRGADIKELAKQFHGINVKLMKTGGYLEAIRQLNEAKENGLKTMIGCMVETSLGIASALQLESLADYIDLDGFMILQDEPFGLVEERDGLLSLNT